MSACGDGDVWYETAAGIGEGSSRSILALPHFIQSCCLFSFQFIARPPLACSRRFACLNCSPAPGAWDVRTGDRFAAAGGTAVCLLLIMSCRSLRLRSFAFVLSADWVFISCLVFFFLLAWPGLVACRRAPSYLRPVFPVPCVSCFRLPRLINPVRSPRRPSCFAPSRYRVAVSVLSPCCPRGGLALVRFSCPAAVSFRHSPRFACRRAGR